MKKKATMTIVLLMSALVVCGGLGYYLYRYVQLDNVFLELSEARGDNPAADNNSKLAKALATQAYFPNDFRDSVESNEFPVMSDKLLEDEQLKVIVGNPDIFVIEFRKKLSTTDYLYITYAYRDHQLDEGIEISNSDKSLESIKGHFYARDKQDDLDLAMKLDYWNSASKGMPTLQLTETTAVLDYLAPYHIDKIWLKQKATLVLNDIVLARWFENGSQRYSTNQLGNVEVVHSPVLE